MSKIFALPQAYPTWLLPLWDSFLDTLTRLMLFALWYRRYRKQICVAKYLEINYDKNKCSNSLCSHVLLKCYRSRTFGIKSKCNRTFRFTITNRGALLFLRFLLIKAATIMMMMTNTAAQEAVMMSNSVLMTNLLVSENIRINIMRKKRKLLSQFLLETGRNCGKFCVCVHVCIIVSPLVTCDRGRYLTIYRAPIQEYTVRRDT